MPFRLQKGNRGVESPCAVRRAVVPGTNCRCFVWLMFRNREEKAAYRSPMGLDGGFGNVKKSARWISLEDVFQAKMFDVWVSAIKSDCKV